MEEEEILAYQVRPTPKPHTLWLEWINRVDRRKASQPKLHALLDEYAKTKAEGKFASGKGVEFLDQLSAFFEDLKALPRLTVNNREDLRVFWLPAQDKRGQGHGAHFLLSFLLFLTIQEVVGHPPKIKVCEYCEGFFLDSSRAYSAKYGDTCHARAKRDARQNRTVRTNRA